MILYFVIIGLFITVLLFVSSRIRRAANTAFEPETVETAEFKINKPEGYLNPVKSDVKNPFEAYSKEYGEQGAGRFRKSLVKMSVEQGLAFKNACLNAKENSGDVYSETILDKAPQGQRICLIEGEKTEDDINRLVFHKIVESRNQNKTYDLEVMILKANEDEFIGKASELINSFTVK